MIQHQQYDHALKSLMSDRAAKIIPELVPDTQFVSEQNVEIKRELLRADLVYRVQYKEKPHTLNLELQTASDEELLDRMLLYHVELLLAFRFPVLSVVLYLFEMKVPEPPFKETSGDEDLLTLKYRAIKLWTLNAREYVDRRIIGMYTFLPGMKGATASLLIQAIEDMKQQFTRPQFVRHLRRFRTILLRSKTVAVQDKQLVEDHMNIHYDSLLDEDPEVQERVARGKIEALQEMALEVIEEQYPSLLPLARERIVHIQQPTLLRQLVKQIFKAPDEKTVHWLLETYTA